MNLTVTIMTAVLLLTLFSPFGVYYGVKIAKKKDYKAHRKIQNIIFIVCVIGVLALEGLIRSEGGSGSLASSSNFYDNKFQKSLPGKLSKFHKTTGYIIFGGLIYTAITALLVYMMTLNII